MNNAKEPPIQRVVVPTVQQANKKKQPAVDPIILKAPSHEVRGLDKSPSPFSFQSEIQRLRIHLLAQYPSSCSSWEAKTK